MKSKRGISKDDRIFYIIVNLMMFLVLLLVAAPILNVIASSISDPKAVSSGKVFFWPKGFSMEGYKAVFTNARVITGFANSLFYTVVGTLINIFMTLICAYPLSRSDLPHRNKLMFLFTFTMIFSGGLIPNYLLIRDLGMINTRTSMLIPGAMTVYNMIVARTFFQSNIPREILEAAKIDGATDFKFFLSIVLPLSKAIIAVLALYYAVSHWNSYFYAFIYLNDYNKYPLQLVLRDILVVNSFSAETLSNTNLSQQDISDILKYALIISSCLPIWIIYPFVQKFFVKGVMVGSIKG